MITVAPRDGRYAHDKPWGGRRLFVITEEPDTRSVRFGGERQDEQAPFCDIKPSGILAERTDACMIPEMPPIDEFSTDQLVYSLWPSVCGTIERQCGSCNEICSNSPTYVQGTARRSITGGCPEHVRRGFQTKIGSPIGGWVINL